MNSALEQINIAKLLNETKGNPELIIAMIDGPVNTRHPAFAQASINNLENPEFIVCQNTDSLACMHGTFIAGVLVASRESEAPGICPACKLLVRPLFCEAKDFDQCPIVSPKELAKVLRKVIDAEAKIINLSIGLSGRDAEMTTELEAAYDYAQEKGSIVIAASGNQAAFQVNPLFKHPWIIPVAAAEKSGQVYKDSNIGRGVANNGLLAPGENVLSVDSKDDYRNMTGTSVAAPFVTGTVALLWSLYPQADAQDIHHCIRLYGHDRQGAVPPMLDAEKSRIILEQILTSKSNREENVMPTTNTLAMSEQEEKVTTKVLERMQNEEIQPIQPQNCSCKDNAIFYNSPEYIYAIGNIKIVFPSKSIEKEYNFAAKELGKTPTDQYDVLSDDNFFYIAEHICWVLQIENVDCYIIKPRSHNELRDLVNCLKPDPSTLAESYSIVIGVRGPIAPPSMCNGLLLPIVLCNQLYYFSFEKHISNLAELNIPNDIASLVLKSMEIKGNNGDEDKERALNFLAFRAPEVFYKAVQMLDPSTKPGGSYFLKGVTTQQSITLGIRKVVDVIFTFQRNDTQERSYWSCGVDVTGLFPFLSTPLKLYVPINQS